MEDLVHIIVEDPGHSLEWSERANRLYLRIRQRPFKPSIIRESQSQRTQFSWTCAALSTPEHHRLAVFYHSNVSQQAETCDCNSERFTAEDVVIKGDKPCERVSRDIYGTSVNDKGDDSISLHQTNSENDLDSADEDRSKDQSNTINDNSNRQDHDFENEDNDCGDEGSQDDDDDAEHDGSAGKDRSQDQRNTGDNQSFQGDHFTNNAKRGEVDRIIKKIEETSKTREDSLDALGNLRTQPSWDQIDFVTPAQWDIDSLLHGIESDPFRKIVHKLRLHLNLEARIESEASYGITSSNHNIRRHKNAMMKESRLLHVLQSDHKAKSRSLDRYLQHGKVFYKMRLLCPGLLSLVAPILTASEIQTVSSHFEEFSASWNRTGLLSTAAKFSDIVAIAEPQEQTKRIPKRVHEASQLNLRSSKRKGVWRDHGLAVSPPVLPTSDITTVTLEDTRSEPPPSRNPLPQYLTQTTTYISSPGRDGPPIVNGGGTTTDGNAHQSFGHLDPAPSYQSNATNGADGSFSSQCPRHDGQYIAPPKERPNPQCLSTFSKPDGQAFDLGPGMGSIADFPYVPTFQISTDESLGLGPGMGSTADFPYVPTFQVSTDEPLGLGPGMGSTADFPYVPAYQVSTDEPLGLGPGMGSTADFPYVPAYQVSIDESIDLEPGMGFAADTIPYDSTYP